MKKASDHWEKLRREVLGLSDSSVYKTHSPDLRQRLAELERTRNGQLQSEAEILERETELQWLIDAIPQHVFILDAGGRPHYVNQVGLTYSGLTLEEVVAKYDNLVNIYHPDDLERVRSERQKAISRGVPLETEARIRGVNGKYRWFLIRIIPLSNEQGQILRWYGTGTDIENHKQAEKDLERQANLLEQTHDAILVWEFPGTIVYWNRGAEQLYGFSRQDAVGRHSHDLLRTAHPMPTELFEVTMERHGSWSGELTQTTRDGRKLIVESRHVLIREPDGRRLVLETNRDITEKKIAEAQLEKYRLHLEDLVKQRTAELARSNRDLEQFAYVASHDLQEPLRAIAGFVRLLQHNLEKSLDGKTREYMDFTVHGVERMQSLINGLLDYSRIDTAGQPPEKTDSEKSLDEALLNLQTSIRETGAKITGHNLPMVNIDPVQLEQLFQNLIGNAIKFRGEKPLEIQVSADRENGSWRFAITDNGIGIEPQYFERIFSIFQRLHTRKKYSGTGIGLSLCKKIVEGHGGKIWVESKPGRGSTFYFTVPEKEGAK